MRALRILAIALAVSALGGCVVGAPEIAREIDVVHWDLRPAAFEESHEFHVGRGLLGLTSTVARWTDDHDAAFAAEILDGIEAVHVGVYQLDPTRDTPEDLTFAARQELEDLGWTLVVRSREGWGESAWVFARQARGHVEMLVVARDRDELSIVRVDGHPARLMEAAIRRDEEFMVAAHGMGSDF